jgi:biopolymer transport protein ExbB
MPSLRKALLCLFAVSATLGSANAFAWWSDDWAFRKEITFDLSPAASGIAGSPADVPVLIRLSLGNFGYFGDTKPDGGDLRFVAADDKTPLKHHIERYDATAQIALVWVRVPRLTGGANTDKIFLYYGNKSAADGGDAPGTYDASQALVYHFGPASGSPQDSTAYKSEPSVFAADVNPASLIGAGAKFTGAQTIVIPATPSLRLLPDKGLTLSAWVRVEGAQNRAYVAQLNEQGRDLALGINGDRVFLSFTNGGAPVEVQQATPISFAEWHHLAARVADGKLQLFVDGDNAGSADITLAEIGGSLTIGGSNGSSNYLTGEIDELEVSNVGRTPEWIQAQARSQGVISSMVVYGGDAQNEPEEVSYFATTLKNVTIDGWVIIAVLAVLFVLSVVIMIGKFAYLGRIAKGNAQFLEEFNKMAADPSVIERKAGSKGEEDGEFGISTLWRLYHHGMRETLKRLEGKAAGADRVKTLSAQSIEAIRATMDASHTRMTQRLSAGMVWLTICISGGPFLGLLGTVVGVMITFAAIAVSGDVNINAIAPGTAAALVATVAGLGVAIPCLFGYNYLNTRIKEIAADQHVFVDEFVTKIAETYS